MQIDSVFYNGVFNTMVSEGDTVEAIAVHNGRIVDMGTNNAMKSINASEYVDCGGHTVIPGLSDTHMHLYADMLNLRTPTLANCRSFEDIKAVLRDALPNVAPGKWLLAENLHVEFLEEGDFPTLEVLDDVSSDIPICLGSFCHHIHILNSAALAEAGIDKDFKEPIAGQVERFEDGRPDGVLRDQVYPEFVDPIIPRMGLQETIDATNQYLEYAASQGMTQLHAYQEDNPFGIRMYQELRNQYGLKCRVSLNWYPEYPNIRGIVTGFGDDELKLGAVKFLSDGSFGGATAYLKEPYANPAGEYGECSFTQDQLDEMVKTAYDAGHELAVHAIGDKANDMVLTAFERAYDPEIGDARRFYFIHATMVSGDWIERASKIPCVISIQPSWFVNYVNFARMRLGDERLSDLFPIRSMMDGGLIVAGGTDAPVTTINPFQGIESSVTRQAIGRDDETLAPSQAISVYEAVEMCTKNAAYWLHEETEKGTLEIGKLADFVVLDRDIFSVEPKTIHEVTPLRTVMGGKTTYLA